ncbi:MAG: hypothetical protein U0744_13595 [Gemmataceae bacterium]
MMLLIDPRGTACALYSEAIDLTALGTLTIRRASHVEPDADGAWHADLAPCGGPRLGPFSKRSEALAAESAWLEARLADFVSLPGVEHDHPRCGDRASP